MAKKEKAKKAVVIISIIVIVISIPAFIYIYFIGRIYPNVFIDNIDLTGKTQREAIEAIAPKITSPKKITLSYNKKNYDIPVNSLDINLDEIKTTKRAINMGRSGNIMFDFTEIINSIRHKTNYPIEISINKDHLDTAIIKIASDINIPPQNAKFEVVNGKVRSFVLDSNGLEVDTEKLESEIINSLNKNNPNEISIEIPTKDLNAEVKASDVNNLGIQELIGSGTSHFAGSASTRVYNINLAASRINGMLVAPNAIFSFDNTVGDISALSGYKQAYVISNGQTILGDGGGVCQVSTTMFRAAMNSGMPITERHAHAYRVHYYEEDADPGFDATIYTPTVDLKFKNDTANYILIETKIDLKNLVLTFNFYGTKDGRTVEITKPTLWGYEPAPEPLYTDDPNLPAGTIQQVDFAASGIKSQFKYTVTKDGKVINDQTFLSVFRPWQAKYLRGTKV